MKVLITNTLMIVIFLGLVSMQSTEKDFQVWVEQGGKRLEPIDGVVKLDKKEFNIVFEFSEPMGLLVNASYDKKTYKKASKGVVKSKLPGFQNTGMAEGILNPEKEIFISASAPSYWYYEDAANHRFNSVEEVDGAFVCRRDIQNLNDIEARTRIKVEDASQPLYLVLISYKIGRTIMDQIEVKREWIEIDWN